MIGRQNPNAFLAFPCPAIPCNADAFIINVPCGSCPKAYDNLRLHKRKLRAQIWKACRRLRIRWYAVLWRAALYDIAI